MSGKVGSQICVPHTLRDALCSIGVGDALAPVNIMTIAGNTRSILLNEI